MTPTHEAWCRPPLGDDTQPLEHDRLTGSDGEPVARVRCLTCGGARYSRTVPPPTAPDATDEDWTWRLAQRQAYRALVERQAVRSPGCGG